MEWLAAPKDLTALDVVDYLAQDAANVVGCGNGCPCNTVAGCGCKP
jgi:hypothetical protein